MPYAVNADLPPSVRSHLPEHAQDIFREAFNHAHAAHAHDPRQEEAAFRIAWAAVKREYVKVGEQWEQKIGRPARVSVRPNRKGRRRGGPWWAVLAAWATRALAIRRSPRTPRPAKPSGVVGQVDDSSTRRWSKKRSPNRDRCLCLRRLECRVPAEKCRCSEPGTGLYRRRSWGRADPHPATRR